MAKRATVSALVLENATVCDLSKTLNTLLETENEAIFLQGGGNISIQKRIVEGAFAPACTLLDQEVVISENFKPKAVGITADFLKIVDAVEKIPMLMDTKTDFPFTNAKGVTSVIPKGCFRVFLDDEQPKKFGRCGALIDYFRRARPDWDFGKLPEFESGCYKMIMADYTDEEEEEPVIDLRVD